MFKRLLPVILVLASPAWATITYYVGPTADTVFADAAGLASIPLSTVDFVGPAATTLTFPAGATFSGFSNGSPATIDYNGTDATFVATGTSDGIQVTLTSDVRAFMVRVSTALLTADWCFGEAGQSCPAAQKLTVTTGTTAYFGVISDTSLLNQAFTVSGTSQLVLKDFQIGKASGTVDPSSSETPESSSMVLLGC